MKYLKQKTKFFIKENESGFTLIEILVIVVIIGLLVGALMVGFSSVKRSSEIKSLMETMTSVTRSAKGCIVEDHATDINAVSAGNPICNSGPSDNYPVLSSKISAKYGYKYSDSYGDEGSFYGYDSDDEPATDAECTSGQKCFVICDVDSGNCYEP